MADDADIDDHAALLGALAALEAPHFHWLGQVAVDVPRPPGVGVIPEPYRSQLVGQGAVLEAVTEMIDDLAVNTPAGKLRGNAVG